jgi:hypothetical protein
MTKKAEFNAEEWSLVLEGPPTAGMIVIMAQKGGTIRETISMAKSYTETRDRYAGTELLDEILAASPEMDPKRYNSPEELRGQGQQRIRDAVALLETKATPEEVDGYKRFVLEVAERAAKAHKEGGFLGMGGEEVSENERAALDELAATLGTERSGA